jgi:xanthine dehydrogenase small subunit
MRHEIEFFLNGQSHRVDGERAFGSLTDYLRNTLGLTGTKVVCSEGDCGACTVLVGRGRNGRTQYDCVDACLLFLYQLHATHVVTVEGLSPEHGLDPIQQALVDCHGSQCGFCTPGFVMALAGWREAGAPNSQDDIKLSLTGNLCRCTGYVQILEAAVGLAAVSHDRSAEPLQNPTLYARLIALEDNELLIEAGERLFYAPVSLTAALAFKADHPGAVIVAGGTELGVLRNKRGYDPPALLSLARISELSVVKNLGDRLYIGANATWNRIDQIVCTALPEFHRVIERFGGPQIRNVATLVGNVAHGSPIADSLPLLAIMDATLLISSRRGMRQRPINGFYQGYKQKDLANDEIITGVELPLPAEDEAVRLYKISRRRDLDIAAFGAGIRIRQKAGVIESAAIAYAGVAPTIVRLPRTEAYLLGRPFEEASFRDAGRLARSEIAPISDVRGSADFRWQLAENILTKFYFDEVGAVVQR